MKKLLILSFCFLSFNFDIWSVPSYWDDFSPTQQPSHHTGLTKDQIIAIDVVGVAAILGITGVVIAILTHLNETKPHNRETKEARDKVVKDIIESFSDALNKKVQGKTLDEKLSDILSEAKKEDMRILNISEADLKTNKLSSDFLDYLKSELKPYFEQQDGALTETSRKLLDVFSDYIRNQVTGNTDKSFYSELIKEFKLPDFSSTVQHRVDLEALTRGFDKAATEAKLKILIDKYQDSLRELIELGFSDLKGIKIYNSSTDFIYGKTFQNIVIVTENDVSVYKIDSEGLSKTINKILKSNNPSEIKSAIEGFFRDNKVDLLTYLDNMAKGLEAQDRAMAENKDVNPEDAYFIENENVRDAFYRWANSSNKHSDLQKVARDVFTSGAFDNLAEDLSTVHSDTSSGLPRAPQQRVEENSVQDGSEGYDSTQDYESARQFNSESHPVYANELYERL